MREPPAPFSSNSLPRGWTSRAERWQKPELILETSAPESISAVTFCPSTITGASLDHLTGNRIWAQEWNGWGSFSGVCSSGCLHVSWFMSWVGVAMCKAYCWLGQLSLAGGWATFPQIPLDWFKADGRAFPCHMAPPLAPKALEGIWVPPISCALPPCASPLATLATALVPWLLVPCPVSKLWGEVVCSELPLLLWEFGQLGVLLPLWPPQPLSQGLLGTLEGGLPYTALVRAAMSLAIYCP